MEVTCFAIQHVIQKLQQLITLQILQGCLEMRGEVVTTEWRPASSDTHGEMAKSITGALAWRALGVYSVTIVITVVTDVTVVLEIKSAWSFLIGEA